MYCCWLVIEFFKNKNVFDFRVSVNIKTSKSDLICKYNLSLGQMLPDMCNENSWTFIIYLFWLRIDPFTSSGYRSHCGSTRDGTVISPRYLIPLLVCAGSFVFNSWKQLWNWSCSLSLLFFTVVDLFRIVYIHKVASELGVFYFSLWALPDPVFELCFAIFANGDSFPQNSERNFKSGGNHTLFVYNNACVVLFLLPACLFNRC